MNEFKTNGFAKIEAYYENQCCNKLTDCVVEKEVSKILPWNHNDEGTERKVYKSCGNYGACNGYTSSITIDDLEKVYEEKMLSDIFANVTQYGVHRDELLFFINSISKFFDGFTSNYNGKKYK